MITNLARKILHAMAKLCAVLCVWLFLVLAFSAAPGFTHKVDVYFPPDGLLKSLPEDVNIVAITNRRMTLASSRSDLALSLYRAGAIILITSENNGCIDLRSKLDI
jgi:hypothetical protein